MKKTQLYWILGAGIIVSMAVILHIEGRLWICACGYVKVWHSLVVSSGNSQHLLDWYSFTHFLHGFLFYLVLWLIDRKKHLSFGAKLVIAIGLAAGWEVLENSVFIINRYRSETVSLDYFGDSVVNSVGDVVSMIAGFYFAYKAKVWQSVLVFILIEMVLALVIHDNLTINIIMLIHPIEALKNWQLSA